MGIQGIQATYKAGPPLYLLTGTSTSVSSLSSNAGRWSKTKIVGSGYISFSISTTYNGSSSTYVFVAVPVSWRAGAYLSGNTFSSNCISASFMGSIVYWPSSSRKQETITLDGKSIPYYWWYAGPANTNHAVYPNYDDFAGTIQ